MRTQPTRPAPVPKLIGLSLRPLVIPSAKSLAVIGGKRRSISPLDKERPLEGGDYSAAKVNEDELKGANGLRSLFRS